MANLIRKIYTKFYQKRHRFVKGMEKHFGVFRLTVSTAVHLQNANAKFYKVVSGHYLCEVENVYISV